MTNHVLWGLVVVFSLIGTLALYDVRYYAMHRTLHRPALMRLIHGVHHRVRYPTAQDSIYVHHAELAAAITQATSTRTTPRSSRSGTGCCARTPSRPPMPAVTSTHRTARR